MSWLSGIGRGLGRATGVHNVGDLMGYAGLVGGLGIGGGITGQILTGAGILGAAGSQPKEPPELQEIRRRLAQGGGYTPQEIAQMRAALTQALGIQRDQAIAQLRQQMGSQGMRGSSQEQMGLQRINSAYADALSQGVGNIMAQSAAQGRETFGQLAGLGLQGELQYQTAQNQYNEGISQMASDYAATRGQGQPAAGLPTGAGQGIRTGGQSAMTAGPVGGYSRSGVTQPAQARGLNLNISPAFRAELDQRLNTFGQPSGSSATYPPGWMPPGGLAMRKLGYGSPARPYGR